MLMRCGSRRRRIGCGWSGIPKSQQVRAREEARGTPQCSSCYRHYGVIFRVGECGSGGRASMSTRAQVHLLLLYTTVSNSLPRPTGYSSTLTPTAMSREATPPSDGFEDASMADSVFRAVPSSLEAGPSHLSADRQRGADLDRLTAVFQSDPPGFTLAEFEGPYKGRSTPRLQ